VVGGVGNGTRALGNGTRRFANRMGVGIKT
jgi:hypothetical protein